MLWINGKMTDLTKKDAIHKLVDAKGFLERYSNPHDKWTEAINIGIEAIEIVMDQEEQEPILDKLRAEIEQLTIVEGGDDYVRKMAELFSLKMKVLQIIDKYKAESEDQNGQTSN